MTKILIIEDELSIAKILSYDLRNIGYEVDHCLDGKDGYLKAQSGQYDILLVDWMLPSLSGVEIISKLRAEGYKSTIIMLTAKTEEEDIIEGLEAGADDYLPKPFSSRVLIARMKSHLRRVKTEKIHQLELGDLNIDLDRYEVTINEQVIDITKIEYELLIYFVKHKNIVLSRDDLLNDIWGFEYDGDTRIVDVHVFKLRSKLKSDKIRIKSVRGVGYMIEEVK